MNYLASCDSFEFFRTEVPEELREKVTRLSFNSMFGACNQLNFIKAIRRYPNLTIISFIDFRDVNIGKLPPSVKQINIHSSEVTFSSDRPVKMSCKISNERRYMHRFWNKHGYISSNNIDDLYLCRSITRIGVRGIHITQELMFKRMTTIDCTFDDNLDFAGCKVRVFGDDISGLNISYVSGQKRCGFEMRQYRDIVGKSNK